MNLRASGVSSGVSPRCSIDRLNAEDGLKGVDERGDEIDGVTSMPQDGRSISAIVPSPRRPVGSLGRQAIGRIVGRVFSSCNQRPSLLPAARGMRYRAFLCRRYQRSGCEAIAESKNELFCADARQLLRDGNSLRASSLAINLNWRLLRLLSGHVSTSSTVLAREGENGGVR